MNELGVPSIEDSRRFVHREAELLDSRQYEEWVDLFAEDGRYWLPGSVGQTTPAGQVSIINDDKAALRIRLQWLRSGGASAQDPPSSTLRQVSNLCQQRADDGALVITCATVVWESRPNTAMVAIPAHTTYVVRDDGERWELVEKVVRMIDPTVHHQNLTFLL